MVSQNGTSKCCLKLVYQNCVPKRSFSPSRDSRAGCFRHGHVPTQMHTSRFQRLIMRMDRRRGTRTKDSQKRSGLTWGLTDPLLPGTDSVSAASKQSIKLLRSQCRVTLRAMPLPACSAWPSFHLPRFFFVFFFGPSSKAGKW